METYIIKAGKKDREFSKFLESYSEEVKSTLLNRLHKYPFPNREIANKIGVKGKVEKKNRFYQYYIDGGNRIIYDIMKDIKTVAIHFFGNHNDAGIFLKKKDK